MSTDAFASYLDLPGGGKLAYRQCDGRAPGVMFLGGFMSEMSGRKACALEAHCRDNRRAFVAFDYRAHGLSSGRIDEFGFDAWIEDSLMVLDRLTRGPQILVGSSMGAWLLTLCLQRRPERIGAALGLAAAPDFIDSTVDALDAAQKTALERCGYCNLPTPLCRSAVPADTKADRKRPHAQRPRAAHGVPRSGAVAAWTCG